MSTRNDTNAPFQGAQDWQQRYDDQSTRWERGALNPAFVYWQKAGEFKGIKSVIIPGCGRSPEPLAFARLGSHVTALDFAPAAITAQKVFFQHAGINAQIEEDDVLAWLPDAPVEAVYDQTCLCALTPAVWQDYADQLHRWLTPGGRAFMLFMQTGKEGGPPFHSPLETMHTLFDDARWQWPTTPLYRSDHMNGKYELGAVLTRR